MKSVNGRIALSLLLAASLACNISSAETTPEVVTVVITATPEAVTIVTEEVATETNATATLNQDLNVRSGPGTNYSIVVALPGGTTVDIIGKNADGSWWFIAFDGNTGWVSAPFTTSSNTENVPVVDAPPPPQSNSGGSGSGGSGSSGSGGSGSGGSGSGGSGGSGSGGSGSGGGGGGQTAPSDNDEKVDVNVKGDSKSLNGAVSYPDGDTTDTIFVDVGGFDSVKTSGNVTYTLTCSGGDPKVTSVGGAIKNGSPGCNKTWTVFYTNDSDKETIKIKMESNGYVNWTLVISAGG
jgi:uncharacterized protein YraI